jgi:molybdate transport system regulatory protein
MTMSSSNTFVGTISRLRPTPILTEVVIAVGGLGELVALITSESCERLDLAEGETVTALVKATEVFFARGGQGASLRTHNCLPGRVVRLELVSATVEIQGELDDGTPVSAIGAADSLESLGLAQGDRVWFFFKAMSLIVSAEKRIDERAFAAAGQGFGEP